MFTLGTKSETLQKLYGKLSCAEVLPQVSFTVGEWQNNRIDVWYRVRSQFFEGGG